MRLFKHIATWLAVAGSAAIVAAETETETKESSVHELNGSNMHSWVGRQQLALVQFFAPWCGYCKALEPAYEKAATELKTDGIPLAKVDCTTSAALCDQEGIKGFPTLKIVMDGKFRTYNGSRQETGIVSYMRKHKGPAVTHVKAAELTEFVKSAHMVVVGYFKSESAAELAVLQEVGRELIEDYTFGYVVDKKAAKKQNMPVPGIAVYTDGDGEASVFSGKYTKDSLHRFIRSRSVPVLGELSSQTFGAYSKAGIPLGLVFYKTDESRARLEKELMAVGKEFRDKVSMAFVDARVYWKHASVLDLKTKWPAFAIQDTGLRTKYPMSQDNELSVKDVRRFVSDFAAGKMQPHYKSAVVPATNDGDVFKLVSKQFNEVVFDKAKDVLVLMYATWCIHCKRMMPVYEELGRLLRPNANIVVAKMEATLNDVPSADPALEVTGYPTIVLVRALDNVVVPYHGDRSLNSFTEFLRVHAAHPVAAQNGEIQRISANGPGYMVVPPQFAGFSPKDVRHDEL